MHRDADPGILLAADYEVTRFLSIGAWQNRLTGVYNQATRPDGHQKIANFHVNFWDVHATYSLPGDRYKGWAVLLGYSTSAADVTEVPQPIIFGSPSSSSGSDYVPRGRHITQTYRSLNCWILRTQQVTQRDQVAPRHPLYIYGALGYHTSAQFSHATNLMLGGSLGISPRFRIAGSVWFNDFDDLGVRATAGLVGYF